MEVDVVGVAARRVRFRRFASIVAESHATIIRRSNLSGPVRSHAATRGVLGSEKSDQIT